MISIIICSIDPVKLRELKNNIAATIGLDFELLAIDNREHNKGICKIYNSAAENARFPYLCFIHEDILFHTKDWGKGLIELLVNPAIGIVGVSGATYKSRYAGSWVACRKCYYRVNMIQHFNKNEPPVHSVINPLNEQYSSVAVIDGVFMSCRKSVWQEFPFDEEQLKGFHGYDLDWSLAVSTRYKVVVTYNILLEHFSAGNFSKKWMQDSVTLHSKWKEILPINITGKNKADRESDYISCSSLLQTALLNRMNKFTVAKYYLQLILFFFYYNRFRFTKTVLGYLFKIHLS